MLSYFAELVSACGYLSQQPNVLRASLAPWYSKWQREKTLKNTRLMVYDLGLPLVGFKVMWSGVSQGLLSLPFCIPRRPWGQGSFLSGRHGGLMVSALDFRSRGLGLSTGRAVLCSCNWARHLSFSCGTSELLNRATWDQHPILQGNNNNPNPYGNQSFGCCHWWGFSEPLDWLFSH